MLVHGAGGGVGHLLVQLAHAYGAHMAAPASSARVDLLSRLGVEVVVDRFADDAIRIVRDRAGATLQCVADLVGEGSVQRSLDVVAEGGRVGSIAELAGDFELAVDRNLALHGLLMQPGRGVLDELAALVAAGKLRPVIDEVLDLEDASRAHERVETGSGQGKVVLDVSGSAR